MSYRSEAVVFEFEEELVLDVRSASLLTIEEAVSLRQKSRTLRAESKRLQIKSRMVNNYASSVAGRAAELSIKTLAA